jgi:EpsI family protein
VLDAHGAVNAAAHAMPEVESWRRTDAPSSWNPIFANADVEAIARFETATASVDLYMATYLVQRQGKEISGYGTSILGGSSRAVSNAHPVDSRWNEQHAVDSRGEEWLFRFSYRIDEHWFTSALRAQLAYGVASLFGAPLSSVVVMRTPCNGDCESARAVLEDFVQASGSLKELP